MTEAAAQKDAFIHIKTRWPTSAGRLADPLRFKQFDLLHVKLVNVWPFLSCRFCCTGEKPSVQPAVFNTCKCKHSCFSVLQGLFFVLFCSSLISFALHLVPNAVNISAVVRLAPFIINRSPSTVKWKNSRLQNLNHNYSSVQFCFVYINPNTPLILSD